MVWVLFQKDKLISWKVKLIEVLDLLRNQLNGFHSNFQENQKHSLQKFSHHVIKEKQCWLMQNGLMVKMQNHHNLICQLFHKSKVINKSKDNQHWQLISTKEKIQRNQISLELMILLAMVIQKINLKLGNLMIKSINKQWELKNLKTKIMIWHRQTKSCKQECKNWKVKVVDLPQYLLQLLKLFLHQLLKLFLHQLKRLTNLFQL